MDRLGGLFGGRKASVATPRGSTLGWCYAFITGALSGYNLVFTKIVSETVKTSARGDDQFGNAAFYAFAACLVLCNGCQIKFLNASMAKFDALFIVPVMQVQWTMLCLQNVANIYRKTAFAKLLGERDKAVGHAAAQNTCYSIIRGVVEPLQACSSVLLKRIEGVLLRRRVEGVHDDGDAMRGDEAGTPC